jgi:tetratricopeptide (TPR) repeat protein
VGASAQADRAAVLSHLQASLAIQPNDSVLAAAARFVGPELGDVAGMRSFLDRVTPEGRGEDRTIYTFMMCGLLERAPDRVLAAAALSMSEYFEDSIIAQPKAWSTALAYRLAGKENLARLEWQNAESTLRQHLQQHPSEVVYQVQLATTLAWLGRRAEAEQFIGPAEPIWREQLTPYRAIGLARYYAALGDAAKAVPLLQFSLGRTPSGSKWMLKLYPWWDKLRGQPEFEALLAQAFASQPKN